MTPPVTGRLTEGAHTLEVEDAALRYHVHGDRKSVV